MPKRRLTPPFTELIETRHFPIVRYLTVSPIRAASESSNELPIFTSVNRDGVYIN